MPYTVAAVLGVIGPEILLGLVAAAVSFLTTSAFSLARKQRRATSRFDHQLSGQSPTVWFTDALASVVRTEWRKNLAVRHGSVVPELDVHWTELEPAGPDVKSWPRVPGSRQDVTSPDRVARAFHEVPGRRLVMLGPPGSGKTTLAVKLTVGLTDRRPKGSRVPVLLSLAGWNPHETNLMDWIGEHLVHNHPFIAQVLPEETKERAVLLEKCVIPILDGLDEIVPHARARALMEIALSPWAELVVTSRLEEYQAAMEESRQPIRGVVTVLLEQPDPTAVMRYLKQWTTPVRAAQWDPVLSELASGRRPELMGVLCHPMTAALAGQAYSDPRRDPVELLDQPPATLLSTLLDAVIEDAFDHRDRWDPQRARRWLSYLAYRMAERNEHSLDWWRVPQLAGRFERFFVALFGVLTMASVFGLGVGLLVRETTSWSGTAAGAGAGALAGLLMVISGSYGLAPSRMRFAGPYHARAILASGLGWGGFGAVAGTLTQGFGTGTVVGVAVWLPLAIIYGAASKDTSTLVAEPGAMLRNDLLVAVSFAGAYGLATGFLGWSAGGPADGITFGVCGALAGGFLYGLPWMIALRTNSTGVAACAQYAIVCTVLAMRGRTPLRLLRFLEAAHARGLLRRVGPTYEFWHTDFRDRLAASVDR